GIIGSQPNTFFGGLWGWKTGNDGCSVYPASSFDSLVVDTSGMDVFCSGHAPLGMDKSRVLVAGGTSPFTMEYGENRARIYNDTTGTAIGRWFTPPDMSYFRFYPTVTPLRDGRALVVAGSQHRQHRIFGGLRSGQAPAKPTADTLYRFAPIPNG